MARAKAFYDSPGGFQKILQQNLAGMRIVQQSRSMRLFSDNQRYRHCVLLQTQIPAEAGMTGMG